MMALIHKLYTSPLHLLCNYYRCNSCHLYI